MWRSRSPLFRTLLELEGLLLVSLAAAWVVCVLIPPAKQSFVSHVRHSHLRSNYRVLRTLVARTARLDPEAAEPDLDTLAQQLTPQDPERKFLESAILLLRAADLPEREIPRRLPRLLRKIPVRDPYLWREKNRLIYRWLDHTGRYAAMTERYVNHPPRATALRLRILKALVRSGGAGAIRPLLTELFPRVGRARLLNDLPRNTRRQLTDLISREDWEHRFDHLASLGRWQLIQREAADCPHDDLVEYFRAADNYRRRRFDRCRRHLARITNPRYRSRVEALTVKTAIREGDSAGIWTRINNLADDRPVHVDLLEDVAGLFLVNNRLDEARKAYGELHRETPTTDSRHWKALWVGAWIEMKQGRRRAARRLFRRGAGSPERGYHIACSFWYRRLGGGGNFTVYTAPFTYYFVQGARNTRRGLEAGLRAFARRLESPMSVEAGQHMERGLRLAELGLPHEAARYLQWARQRARSGDTDATMLTLAAALMESRLHRHYQAFVTFRTGIPDYQSLRLPRFLREIPAPLEFRDLIARNSRERGLDPYLVTALIREESMFRTDSRSHANAYGLMQMLPRTYAHLSGRRLTSRLRWELIRPETNIRWGTLYLRRLLDKYGSREYLALAAYNAGDHRVDRWLRQFGNVDAAQFIEMIPFTQTRNYVKNILRNRFYYAFYHPHAFPAGADSGI